MRLRLSHLLILGTFVAVSIPSGAVASDREDIIKFLRKNVIDRTIAAKITVKMANNTVETDFERRTTFSYLVETKDGFMFDAVIAIKQDIYDLDDDGKRIKPGRIENRNLTVRYEFSLRKSTGRMRGFSRLIANSTGQAITGLAQSAEARIDGDTLVVDSETIGYSDHWGKGGEFFPGAHESNAVYSMRDGRLRRTETNNFFDVDPKTMKRTPNRDKPEVMIEEEVVK